MVNSHLLYQLSYRGTFFNNRGKEENIVEVPVVSRSCAAKTFVAAGECRNASYPCKERPYAGGRSCFETVLRNLWEYREQATFSYIVAIAIISINRDLFPIMGVSKGLALFFLLF